MKSLTATLLFLCLSASAILLHGQELFQCGSRSHALANTTTTLSDCWSAFENQAGLAKLKQPEAGCFFLNRFGINELATQAGVFVLPIQSSVFALSIAQFGKTPFKQENYGLSYARPISPKLNFGLRFHYSRVFFPEDNRYSGTIGIDIGVQATLTRHIILGVHIHNPYPSSIHTLNEKIQYPSQIKIGSTFYLSEVFSLITELENDFYKHSRLRSAFEYTIIEKFTVRAGITGSPYQRSAGFGFQLKKLIIDLANSYHSDLGNTSSISFKYEIR